MTQSANKFAIKGIQCMEIGSHNAVIINHFPLVNRLTTGTQPSQIEIRALTNLTKNITSDPVASAPSVMQ